ncbi:MAG: hypothetical protein KC506_00315 [Nanoarchaeota archaeon]|nr:hypothetical protein [Nanoarchaeota archaeon]
MDQSEHYGPVVLEIIGSRETCMPEKIFGVLRLDGSEELVVKERDSLEIAGAGLSQILGERGSAYEGDHVIFRGPKFHKAIFDVNNARYATRELSEAEIYEFWRGYEENLPIAQLRVDIDRGIREMSDAQESYALEVVERVA